MKNSKANKKPAKSALEIAANHADADTLVRLLQDGAELQVKREGNILLGVIRSGSLEALKLLLERGVNSNARDDRGGTALTEAAIWARLDMIPLLLDAGADASMHDCYGRSALWYNVEDGTAETIDLLLRYPSDMYVPAENGVTPFMRILLNDKITIDYLEKLLDYDVDINAQDAEGLTALWFAVMGYEYAVTESQRDVVCQRIRFLLDHGANPNLQHILSGNSLLVFAAERGMARVVELLLAYGADQNLKNAG